MSQEREVTLVEALQIAQRAIAAGQNPQAETILRQILTAVPDQPNALHMLGRLAVQAQRPEIGLPLLARAAALLPNESLAHLDLGNAFLTLGRLTEAANAYRRCIALRPDHDGAWSNLGISLHEEGRSTEAIEAFQKARDLSPNVADRYNNLGTALSSLGSFHEAVDSYRHAMSLDAKHGPTRHNLANALKEIGRIEEAIDLTRQNLVIAPTASIVHGNLLVYLQYDTRNSPEDIFREHRRWNEIHAAALTRAARPHTNLRDPQRRLKIGYLSPDFREHSVSYFIEPLLAHHDRAEVELFCYADSLRKDDPVSDRLRSLAAHWTNITGISDEQVAEIIRKDQIDILIDLAGHTSNGRLLVLARKPAPVQISYLGYPSTTGLDAVDYYLTDPYLDPRGVSEHLFSERLLRLPETFAVYQPPADAPPVSALPALRNGFVTFGSFNIFPKLNPRVLETWAAILRRVPTAHLLIMGKGMNTPQMAEHVRDFFTARGVDESRLDLTGYGDRNGYLQAHSRVDILLDPFPVNGHTISCHALWMGVPLVTLAGDRHCARLGASVLSNLKLQELIAHTADDYIQIATDMAGDLPRLDTLRQTMRPRMEQSPILAYASFAKAVEAAYRQAWQDWCRAR